MDYKRVYGNCNVPQDYKANKQLGGWVSRQRKNNATMSENKRNQLDSIGFAWRLKVPWEVRFQQLVEYKRIHGHCNVSTLDKVNKQLGRWAMTQQQNNATMSENKRNQLDSIGFAWRLKAGQLKQRQVRPSTVEDPKKKKNQVGGGSCSRRHGVWTEILGFQFRTAS